MAEVTNELMDELPSPAKRPDLTASPASIQRRTILIVGGVGLLVFLLMAGFAGYMLWTKYSHSQSWTPVSATVESVDHLCDVQKKSGKSWSTEAVMPCDEAAKFVQQQDGVLTPWRSVEADYAKISYVLDGVTYRQTLRVELVAESALAAGQQTPMLANPANPNEVQKPFSSADVSTFWIICGIGLAVWVLATLVGWFVARMNGRYQAAAARAAVASAANPFGVTVGASGAAVAAAEAPAWSKLLRWLGIALLILGTLFAVIAGIAALREGSADGQVGAGIIFALALIAWAVLTGIARLGAPGAPARQWGR